jgi:hypothetical protein
MFNSSPESLVWSSGDAAILTHLPGLHKVTVAVFSDNNDDNDDDDNNGDVDIQVTVP